MLPVILLTLFNQAIKILFPKETNKLRTITVRQPQNRTSHKREAFRVNVFAVLFQCIQMYLWLKMCCI